MARKRRTGRRVYYKPFSHNKSRNSLLTAQEMKKEGFRRGLVLSEANVKWKEAQEEQKRKVQRGVLRTLGYDIPEPQNVEVPLPTVECNDPRMVVELQLECMNRLADYDQHIVLHKGLKTVRILFQNKEGTAYWIIERNMFTGKLKRSVDYGSREQAMMVNDADCILFALVDYIE